MDQRHSLPAMLLVFLLLFLPYFPLYAAEQGYAGSKACLTCHDNLSRDWPQSRHARAFDSLKKSGQENLPGCVRCHVTGYGLTGGFIDQELTPGLAGVQCEECHGAGKAHVTAPDRHRLVAKPQAETCRRCHTSGQDPNFDYAGKVRGVHKTTGIVRTTERKSILTATPALVDLGMVDEGIPARATVTVQNNSDTTVVITDLRTN
ncbi:MAG: Perchlorate reductase subunit gamma precursor [Syntrophorhabdaceae bacterium PtaU1.Bin034]|nr:MAG: Perchlorate reductase subunit gamma precursor [Syntrophorhabdaceae bacterium PtaU1.Bin034]